MSKGLMHRPFEGLLPKDPKLASESKWSDSKKYEAHRAGQKETMLIDGRLHRRVPSGYTIRQFFSHHTEKGPGPGWDTRVKYLLGIGLDPWDTPKLPDDPYYLYEPIDEEQEQK